MMASIKTPEGLSTVQVDSLFQPFAAQAADGDLCASEGVSSASFYNLADTLRLEDMFAAARPPAMCGDASVPVVSALAPVPDIDNVEELLTSVPSSLIDDLGDVEVPAEVPERKRTSRKAKPKARPKRATGGARKRAQKVPVPDHLKDAKYFARRAKNNEAARRNRAMKKLQKAAEKSLLPQLDAKREQLVDEVSLLQQELKGLRQALRERLIREGLSDLRA
jgi:hypothetical protein